MQTAAFAIAPVLMTCAAALFAAGAGSLPAEPTTSPVTEEEVRELFLHHISTHTDGPFEGDPPIYEEFRQHPAIVAEVVRDVLQENRRRPASFVQIMKALSFYRHLKPGGAKVILPLVEEYLHVDEPRIRKSAVKTLAEVGGVQYAPIFAVLLNDQDVLVRYAAVEALGATGGQMEHRVLRLWVDRTIEQDADRPEARRWYVGVMKEAAEKALKQTEARGSDDEHRPTTVDA